MPSPFDALDAAMSAVVMDNFGETVAAILRPRTESQYVERAVDGARPETTVRGIFSAGPSEGDIRGNSTAEFKGTTRMAQIAAEFWLPASEVAALAYTVAQGDLLRFPGRPSSPEYVVVRIQWSDMGDMNLILAAENQP